MSTPDPAPFYRDEWVTLYHGDCREILPLLPTFDLLCTDPPYGHGERWSGGTWGAHPMYAACFDWDATPVENSLLLSLIAQARAAIIWGGNYYRLPPARCLLAWEKSSKMATLADFELAWTSLNRPAKLFREDRNPDGKRQHPTQKPLSVMIWCLSFAPGSVFDPFCGVGTTMIAAKKLGRKSIGIEIDEQYCQVAAERLVGTTPNLFMPTPVALEQESMFPTAKGKRR